MGAGTLHSDDYKKLCEMLKQARLSKGLTQQEIADLLGKPQSYVAKYERAERRLDVLEFVAISNALDVRAEVILKHFEAISGDG